MTHSFNVSSCPRKFFKVILMANTKPDIRNETELLTYYVSVFKLHSKGQSIILSRGNHKCCMMALKTVLKITLLEKF